MFVLKQMEKINLVIQVGIDTLRWVSEPYSRPWFIHTNKISR